MTVFVMKAFTELCCRWPEQSVSLCPGDMGQYMCMGDREPLRFVILWDVFCLQLEAVRESTFRLPTKRYSDKPMTPSL